MPTWALTTLRFPPWDLTSSDAQHFKLKMLLTYLILPPRTLSSSISFQSPGSSGETEEETASLWASHIHVEPEVLTLLVRAGYWLRVQDLAWPVFKSLPRPEWVLWHWGDLVQVTASTSYASVSSSSKWDTQSIYLIGTQRVKWCLLSA